MHYDYRYTPSKNRPVRKCNHTNLADMVIHTVFAIDKGIDKNDSSLNLCNSNPNFYRPKITQLQNLSTFRWKDQICNEYFYIWFTKKANRMSELLICIMNYIRKWQLPWKALTYIHPYYTCWISQQDYQHCEICVSLLYLWIRSRLL